MISPMGFWRRAAQGRKHSDHFSHGLLEARGPREKTFGSFLPWAFGGARPKGEFFKHWRAAKLRDRPVPVSLNSNSLAEVGTGGQQAEHTREEYVQVHCLTKAL
jgi:hypothetical protein